MGWESDFWKAVAAKDLESATIWNGYLAWNAHFSSIQGLHELSKLDRLNGYTNRTQRNYLATKAYTD